MLPAAATFKRADHRQRRRAREDGDVPGAAGVDRLHAQRRAGRTGGHCADARDLGCVTIAPAAEPSTGRSRVEHSGGRHRLELLAGRRRVGAEQIDQQVRGGGRVDAEACRRRPAAPPSPRRSCAARSPAPPRPSASSRRTGRRSGSRHAAGATEVRLTATAVTDGIEAGVDHQRAASSDRCGLVPIPLRVSINRTGPSGL